MGQSDSLVGGVEEQGGGQGSDSSVDYVATDTEHAASEDNIHDIIVPLITELSTHLQNHGLRTLDICNGDIWSTSQGNSCCYYAIK